MEPILISIIITGIATFVAAVTYKNRKKAFQKKIRKAPFKRIAMVEEGETVTIAGNIVIHQKQILAPLSDRECVFYHATVERKKSSGKNTDWVTEINETTAVQFLLDDGDHLALINTNKIEGCLELDKNYKSGTFNPATPKMEAFLNKYKITSKGPMGYNKNLRYKEGALEKHEYCVVCGTCYWEKAVKYGIESVEDILVIKDSGSQPVYISDIKDILI
jgi:hypothetical protein